MKQKEFTEKELHEYAKNEIQILTEVINTKLKDIDSLTKRLKKKSKEDEESVLRLEKEMEEEGYPEDQIRNECRELSDWLDHKGDDDWNSLEIMRKSLKIYKMHLYIMEFFCLREHKK